MTKYLVTTELETSWFTKLKRFLRLAPPRKEFEVVFTNPFWETSDTLILGEGAQVKVVKRVGYYEVDRKR